MLCISYQRRPGLSCRHTLYPTHHCSKPLHDLQRGCFHRTGGILGMNNNNDCKYTRVIYPSLPEYHIMLNVGFERVVLKKLFTISKTPLSSQSTILTQVQPAQPHDVWSESLDNFEFELPGSVIMCTVFDHLINTTIHTRSVGDSSILTVATLTILTSTIVACVKLIRNCVHV